MEHLTLCGVWLGRIPSSSFWAEKKGRWPSRTWESSPFPSPCSITLGQPQSREGENVRRGLKRNIGNGERDVFFCGSQLTEASRGQPSIGAGVSDTALIHSTRHTLWEGDSACFGTCSWGRVGSSQPFTLPMGSQCPHEINCKGRCRLGFTWFQGELIRLKFLFNTLNRESNVLLL